MTHDDLGAGELPKIESMHRLAVFEHHVIAKSDDVIDRTQADGGETLLHPVGRRTDFDAGDNRGSIERTISRHIDTDGLEQIGACVGDNSGGREADDGIREVFLKPSGKFASDAEVRKRVRTVGCDLDVEHGVAGGQDVVDRRADEGFAGQEKQSLGIFGEREFFRSAHHAGGGLSANLGLLDDKVSREIWRTANDGAHAAVDGADIDGADGELVGVGVFVAGDDVANDDVVEFGSAGADDLLDLKAEKSDRARNIIGRDTGEIDVGLKPVE